MQMCDAAEWDKSKNPIQHRGENGQKVVNGGCSGQKKNWVRAANTAVGKQKGEFNL